VCIFPPTGHGTPNNGDGTACKPSVTSRALNIKKSKKSGQAAVV
jgi:hypothetical protein